MNLNDPIVKKFGDILVNTANEGKGRFEKRLKGWLRVIARRKHRGIPPKLIDELTRVNSKTRFQWWSPLSSPSGLIAHGVSKKHEVQWTSRPHLAFYWQKPFTPMDFYLSALIPRLQDPTWVNALRECPGCGKLLLVDVKWENKWCSPQCRKRHWAREHRKGNKLKESKRGKIERIQRNCLRCDRPFLADGKFNRICPACTAKNNKGG